MTDATLLKFAPVAKWCSVGDFPQDIIILLCSGPDLALGPWLCDLMRADGVDLNFILDFNLIWAQPGSRPWTLKHKEANGLGPYLMPV